MRLTLWISHQIVSEGVKTSKQQHSTLRYIVKNKEPQFEKNSLRWLLWQKKIPKSEKRSKRHAIAPAYDSVVPKYLLHISSYLQTNGK